MSVSASVDSQPSLVYLSDSLLRLCLRALGLCSDVFQDCNLQAWQDGVERVLQESETQHLLSTFLSDPPNVVHRNFIFYYQLCVNARSFLPALPLPHSADKHFLRKSFTSERLLVFFKKAITLLEELCMSEALGIASASARYLKEKVLFGTIEVEATCFKFRDCETFTHHLESFRKTRKSLTRNSGGGSHHALGSLDLFCLTLATLMSVSETDISKARINSRQCKVLQLAYKRVNASFVQLLHLFSIVEAWHPFLSMISLFDGLGKELCRLLLDGHKFVEDCCRHTWSNWKVTRVCNHWELLVFLENIDFLFRELVSKIQIIIDKSPRSRFKMLPWELSDLQAFLTQAAERDYQRLHLELQEFCTRFDRKGSASESEHSEQTSSSDDRNSARHKRGDAYHNKQIRKAKWLWDSLVCHTKVDLENSRFLHIEPEHVKRGLFLGEGSSARVYEADCWGEKYAMKQLRTDDFSFRDEIFLHFKFRHPNIVRVIGYTSNVESNPTRAFLMELMSCSLREHMDTKPRSSGSSPYPQQVSADIMLQIASGMEYLHRQNIAHRDLKASNVLVDRGKSSDYWGEGYMHVKIADFGLARELTRRDLTAPIGTWAWRAPEITSTQKHLKRPLDDALDLNNSPYVVSAYGLPADVYSFGITCYEIVSGATPFAEECNRHATLLRIMSGLRPTLPDNIHPDLASLIKACWEGKPEHRPSFAEICCKLRKVKFELLHPRFNETFAAIPSS